MRTVTFGGANSLDNYFARKDGAVDWLLWGDEVGLNVHPVLLGSGIPVFFEMNRQIGLELKECKVLKTGCVALTYRVKH